MTSESAVILEQLVRENDLGWMIDKYHPRERAIPKLLEQLTAMTHEFRTKFGYDLSFSPEQLSAESKRNPHKIRAFLQALAASGKVEMLLMVWRILQGLSIKRVMLDYAEESSFRLTVVLARPCDEGGGSEEYSSEDISDALLLRHFGITKVSKRPLFIGFFPQAGTW